MKKSRGLIVTFVPLLIVAVGLWFFPGSSAFADDHHSPTPSPSSHDSDHHDSDHHDSDHHDSDHHDSDHTDEHDKCTVCHDPHNFHEISIPCGQVDKFLGDHPGDYRGHCSTTPSTNK